MARKTESGLLTVRQISGLGIGLWATDSSARGAGALQVRKLSNGSATFYYRYTAPDGKRIRIAIGTGIDLATARRKAAKLSRQYQDGDRDLRSKIEAERREVKRLHDDAEAKASADAAVKRATLGALLIAYVEQLEKHGKTSAKSVGAAFTRHVREPWPGLWKTPANDVSTDDLVSVLALLTDTNKLREASKLRSYLMAAYTAAIGAKQDARATLSLRELKITHNPARDIVTIKGANQPRERALSVAELRAYWNRINALNTPDGALLRFHLLTGGQRVEQLARVTVNDFDPDLKTIRLLDGKGRRATPRKHIVPLISSALVEIKHMGRELGPYLFTVTNGESGASYASVERRIRAVADDMSEAGELDKGLFTAGDIRRTVETRLAALGVSMDVRAQIQSHGLSGVQSRHYDKHDYLEEKRGALKALHRLLTHVGEASSQGVRSPKRK
jgi:hypothetical protein